MISAMPAVAVRRERKKSKSYRNSLRSHASNNSLAGYGFYNRANSKRSTTQSISTVSSLPYARRPSTKEGLYLEKMRYLMYVGTVLLVAGLALVFIGVGADIPGSQTIGLVFIGAGSFFCLIKVFCTKSETTLPRKPVVAPLAGLEQNNQHLFHHALIRQQSSLYSPSLASTPGSENLEFASLLPMGSPGSPDQMMSPMSNDRQPLMDEANSNHTNSSLTPTSLNSIPETQVLIPEDRERY